MQKTIRNIYWLIIGLSLGLTIPWLFANPSWGASWSLGGGHFSPHSYSGAYSLEKGWLVSASLEDIFYENNTWDMSGGILHVVTNHERHDNHTPYREHTINSHVLALYAKPHWYLTERLKPFLMGGVGGSLAGNFEPCVLVGAGVNYIFHENWSLEGGFFKVWDREKVYRIKPMLSIRYEF